MFKQGCLDLPTNLINTLRLFGAWCLLPHCSSLASSACVLTLFAVEVAVAPVSGVSVTTCPFTHPLSSAFEAKVSRLSVLSWKDTVIVLPRAADPREIFVGLWCMDTRRREVIELYVPRTKKSTNMNDSRSHWEISLHHGERVRDCRSMIFEPVFGPHPLPSNIVLLHDIAANHLPKHQHLLR